MILPEYSDLKIKNQMFDSMTVDDVNTFETLYKHLSEQKHLIFRGVTEAKYKIYTSAQRNWIIKGLGNHVGYIEFINRLLCNIRSNKILADYYRSLNIIPNDLLHLVYLQHYGAPSPMLDFTYNLNIGLYFALDCLKENNTTNVIGDYLSLYTWDMEECGNELANIVDVFIQGLQSGQYMYDNYMAMHPNAIVNNQLLRDVDEFTRWIKSNNDGLFCLKCALLDNPMKANKLVMNKTNQQLLWSNMNIIAQEGCLLMYTKDVAPLEEYIENQGYLPKLKCYNIHKSLAEYIRKKIALSQDRIYPQEEKIAKSTFLDFLQNL